MIKRHFKKMLIALIIVVTIVNVCSFSYGWTWENGGTVNVFWGGLSPFIYITKVVVFMLPRTYYKTNINRNSKYWWKNGTSRYI